MILPAKVLTKINDPTQNDNQQGKIILVLLTDEVSVAFQTRPKSLSTSHTEVKVTVRV